MLRNKKPLDKAYNTIFWVGNPRSKVVEQLEARDFFVKTFTSPVEAYVHCLSLAFANQAHPYSILVDEDALGEEAYKLIKSLHYYTPLRDVPTLLLNEHDKVADFRKVKSLGADDYYVGDFGIEDLLDRIGFLSETKQMEVPVKSNVLPRVKIAPLKRLSDILIAGTALLVLSPILLVIALLIKLDSKGPVFYISKRVGTGYRIFNFYKFRSMRQDADKLMEQYMHLNQYQGNGKSSAFVKIANDPRITKLGKFLRDTSLDELPQLFNVVMGHMSIVGNRPLPLYEAELVTRDLWSKRFMAPAGITGLWQVTKRGSKEMSEEERISLDMAYADKSSLWYDVKIMARTLPALLQKESV